MSLPTGGFEESGRRLCFLQPLRVTLRLSLRLTLRLNPSFALRKLHSQFVQFVSRFKFRICFEFRVSSFEFSVILLPSCFYVASLPCSSVFISGQKLPPHPRPS